MTNRLVAQPHPFAVGAADRVDVNLPEGLTVEEMIDLSLTDPFAAEMKRRGMLRVQVGDQQIPQELWGVVRPKAGVNVVVRGVPMGGGGGGGGKNPLRLVLMIAVIALTFYLGPIVGAALFGTSIINAGLAVGLTVGQGIAITSAIGSAIVGFAGNLLVNALVPPPKPAALSAKTPSLGLAPSSRVLSLTGVRNRANQHGSVIRVYGTHRVYPVLAAQPYSENANGHQYLRMLFDFGYGPLSLTELKIGDVSIDSYQDVEYEIRQGYPSDAETTLYSRSVFQDEYSLPVTNSEPAVVTSRTNADQLIVDLTFQGLYQFNSRNERVNYEVDLVLEYRAVGAGSWTAHSTPSVEDNSDQIVRRSYTITPPSPGQYEVRVSRTTADDADERQRSLLFVNSLKTIIFQHPINAEGRCLVAMRIRASNQLNGVVDTFNAVAQSILPKWNGSSWAEAATNNPAWVFADILKGTANRNPVSDDRIDLAALLSWANACDADAGGEPKWEFNAVVDFRTTVFEMLREVAASSRAAFSMADGKYSVVRDVAQSTPVQHLTPRNSWNFRGRKTFEDHPHAIRARFVSAQNEYKQDEVTVYDDGYDALNATTFEVMEFPGCTSPNQAYREARYHMAVSRLRPEVFELMCDVENLVCTRGDLVRITHDVPRFGLGSARVKSVTTGGGGVTAVEIDDVLTMVSGTTYAVRVRLADGSSALTELTTVAGEQTTLTFSSTLITSPLVAEGDLVMMGVTGSESAEMLVKEVQPGPDLSARLILVDYAPAVLTADQGSLPAYDPQQTFDPSEVAPPALANLRVLEIAQPLDGRWLITLSYSWEIPIGYFAREFHVYRMADDGTFERIGTTEDQHFELRGVTRGERVTVAVVGVSPTGNVISIAQGARVAHNVVGSIPPDLPGLNLTALKEFVRLQWVVDNTTVARRFELRWSPLTSGATWGNSTLLQYVSYPQSTADVPARAGTYLIKAVDEYEISSDAAAVAITEAPNLDLNVVETSDQHSAFAGTVTNAVGTAGELFLDGVELFDDQTGLFDDRPGLFDSNGGGFVTSGSYLFDFSGLDYLDLGSSYVSKITAHIKATADDQSVLFDDWTGLFDDRPGLFDGTLPEGVTNVTLEVRTTDDDPSGSSTWGSWGEFVVGDYSARAFQFRAVLTGPGGTITPVVEELTVTVDMPDRTVAENDLTASSGGETVTFPGGAFKALQAVVVTGDDMQQGDYWTITSKSVTGFTIQFRDSGGVGVSRNFDYIAKGYGAVQ